jgi:hypothetical protein
VPTALLHDGHGQRSRLLQFAWLSRLNDVRFVANAYLTLTPAPPRA